VAISAISNAVATAANTVTMSTHTTGDLILASVWRNSSTTRPQPSLVAGRWRRPDRHHVVDGRVLQDRRVRSETTGTWTSANCGGGQRVPRRQRDRRCPTGGTGYRHDDHLSRCHIGEDQLHIVGVSGPPATSPPRTSPPTSPPDTPPGVVRPPSYVVATPTPDWPRVPAREPKPPPRLVSGVPSRWS
jgi:hypothetical protein